MTTVVYGDFNCPYSYLASLRVDVLREAGVDVEWRAVEHAPTIPVMGRRLDDAGRADLDAELSEVRGLLGPGEPFPLNAVAMIPHTEAAISGYAEAVGAGVGDPVRRLLFEAYWVRGLDIGSPEVLRSLLAREIARGNSSSFTLHESGFAVAMSRGPITAGAHRRIHDWREAWSRTGTRTIPSIVTTPTPDNVTSRPPGNATASTRDSLAVIDGVAALTWLAAYPAQPARSDRPTPAFA